MEILEKGKAVVRLVRANNLGIILFTQAMVWYFLVNEKSALPDVGFYLLAFSTLCIAAAGYIINDYYDVKIDLINKPDQLIVGKVISRREAIILHTIFNSVGIGMGAFMSWRVGLFHAACAFLLWLYSNRLKQIALLGNIAIGLLTALSVMVLALFYHHYDPFIFLFGLYAFFMTLIREIVKDIEDMKGDASFGCKTLPIWLGLRPTKNILYAILLVLVGLYLALAQFLHMYSYFYMGYSVGLAILLVILYVLLYKADTKKEFNFLSRYIKWIMVFGVLGISLI